MVRVNFMELLFWFHICVHVHVYILHFYVKVFLTVDQGQKFLKTTSLEKAGFQSPSSKAHVTLIQSLKEAR